MIEEKKASVTCGTLPVLRSNATLIRVLFQNLLGNALKFQDGSQTPVVRIGAENNGASWQFSIIDNGIGIDPKQHHKVFTIFQRLHRKDRYPGTGIGLSTCKKFIELCGGRIWFESIPGQGTSFFFTLPCQEAS
jgi:light-regulated signal transduction histidine kinase (bacteriophytochrome)